MVYAQALPGFLLFGITLSILVSLFLSIASYPPHPPCHCVYFSVLSYFARTYIWNIATSYDILLHISNIRLYSLNDHFEVTLFRHLHQAGYFFNDLEKDVQPHLDHTDTQIQIIRITQSHPSGVSPEVEIPQLSLTHSSFTSVITRTNTNSNASFKHE